MEILAYTPNLTLDFNGAAFRKVTASGNLAINTANRGAIRMVTLFIFAGSSDINLTFDPAIRWAGPKPTALGANKLGVLSLTSTGPDEDDTVAAYSSE